MAALPALFPARCHDVPLGSGPPAPGLRCRRSVGAGGAPGHTSHGEATCAGSAQPGRSARRCHSPTPGQWHPASPAAWGEAAAPGGAAGAGMAFCLVPPAAAGPRPGRTEESQVSSRAPLLAIVPLRQPRFSQQPRPGAGAGVAAGAGPAPGRQPGPQQPQSSRMRPPGCAPTPPSTGKGPGHPPQRCPWPRTGSSGALAGLTSTRT